ncbi:MAG: tetratricopeptide repeat protein [Armatimonadetes bacterium]|nr:tetratricopeptide repeat protein [Armatimonadota bacterium]MDE2206004.1 tetratricopeptide repeat protein [Armatimonadota bacterium]
MNGLPTGRITFLLTDIVNSTPLWDTHSEAMRIALQRHDAIGQFQITRHGGHLVKARGEGDSLFCVFERADDAVAASLALQRRMVHEDWNIETAPNVCDRLNIRVRVALNTGEADHRDGDYFGGAVNRCARIRALAHGGQILLSAETVEALTEPLPEGARLRDVGRLRLRGLSRPERIYLLTHPELPADMLPIRLDSDYPNNLPRQLTTFVGREDDISAVKDRLLSSPMVTLVGPGGSGKSRLALEVAEDLLAEYTDGVWLAELATTTDAMMVAHHVAGVLNVREEPGRTVERSIADHLRDRRVLLLLDNCEHLIAATAQLAHNLLQACPRLHILATSREALGIPGENVYTVRSLSFPASGQPTHSLIHAPITASPPTTARHIEKFESVRLFVDRAAVAFPGFRLADDNAPSIAQICRTLDGIPLAIELAAARVKSISTEDIATRLNDRFRLLTGGARTALPRQQTLRALIDWSYDLLTPEEREMFHRLSVFLGGFSLKAAEEVTADRDESGRVRDGRRASAGGERYSTRMMLQALDVVDLLGRLVDRSLLVCEDDHDQVRYRMMETLRHYAREKAVACGILPILQRRHLDYYVGLSEEAEKRLRGTEQAAWLERLETEHDNIRAALNWALSAGADPQAGLRIAANVWWFWHVRGHFTEGREWLHAALEEAPERTALRGRALNSASVLARNQGDYDSAQRLASQSLEIKRAMGDRQGIASSLNSLATLALSRSDYDAARPWYEESLDIERSLGNRQGVTACLIGLANIAVEQGDTAQARRLYQESLNIKQEFGDRRGIAASLVGLAKVATLEGDWDEAHRLCNESLDLRRVLGDQRGIAHSLQHLGEIAMATGRWAAAADLLDESLALRVVLGDKQGVATARRLQGHVALETRDLPLALDAASEALVISRKLEARRPIAAALCLYACIASYVGAFESAVRLLAAGNRLRAEVGSPANRTEAELYSVVTTRASKALGAQVVALLQHEKVPLADAELDQLIAALPQTAPGFTTAGASAAAI